MSNNKFNITTFYFLALIFISQERVYAQNFYKNSISVNLTGMVFNDFSLFYDIKTKNNKNIGLSIGYMIANNWWNRDVGGTGGFEVNDDKYPLGAYNGPLFRISYSKVYITENGFRTSGP